MDIKVISHSPTITAAEAAGNSTLGIGHMASVSKEAMLPNYIAPKAVTWAAKTPRALGGLATLGTSAYRIANTYNADSKTGNFKNTRREVFVTASSVSGSLAAGTVAGVLTAGAAAVSAPAVIIGGIAAAGIVGAGYAAYYAGEWAGSFFDRVLS